MRVLRTADHVVGRVDVADAGSQISFLYSPTGESISGIFPPEVTFCTSSESLSSCLGPFTAGRLWIIPQKTRDHPTEQGYSLDSANHSGSRVLPHSKQQKDADYVFYELTWSICPNCRRVIDAKILLRDNKVYMAKRCPECGPFEALVFGDAQAYTSFSRFNKPGTIPLAHGTEIKGRVSLRLRPLPRLGQSRVQYR